MLLKLIHWGIPYIAPDKNVKKLLDASKKAALKAHVEENNWVVHGAYPEYGII